MKVVNKYYANVTVQATYDIEIEAESLEAAKEIANGMNLEELEEKGLIIEEKVEYNYVMLNKG